MTTFRERVVAVVKGISKGETLSYGEVAQRAGNKKGTRAVGAIMRTNFDPEIPCHRVVRSDGSLGGYNRGHNLKRKKLADEQR